MGIENAVKKWKNPLGEINGEWGMQFSQIIYSPLNQAIKNNIYILLTFSINHFILLACINL